MATRPNLISSQGTVLCVRALWTSQHFLKFQIWAWISFKNLWGLTADQNTLGAKHCCVVRAWTWDQDWGKHSAPCGKQEKCLETWEAASRASLCARNCLHVCNIDGLPESVEVPGCLRDSGRFKFKFSNSKVHHHDRENLIPGGYKTPNRNVWLLLSYLRSTSHCKVSILAFPWGSKVWIICMHLGTVRMLSDRLHVLFAVRVKILHACLASPCSIDLR